MHVKTPSKEEMKSVYLMGLDAWGAENEDAQYLAECGNSSKYKLGQWYCVEDQEELVSSIIIYKDCFGLSGPYFGLGSLATKPSYRNRGYASFLLGYSIKNILPSDTLGVFLNTEVGVDLYIRYGFEQVSERTEQGLMFLSLNDGRLPELPGYF